MSVFSLLYSRFPLDGSSQHETQLVDKISSLSFPCRYRAHKLLQIPICSNLPKQSQPARLTDKLNCKVFIKKIIINIYYSFIFLFGKFFVRFSQWVRWNFLFFWLLIEEKFLQKLFFNLRDFYGQINEK